MLLVHAVTVGANKGLKNTLLLLIIAILMPLH